MRLERGGFWLLRLNDCDWDVWLMRAGLMREGLMTLDGGGMGGHSRRGDKRGKCDVAFIYE